MATELKITLTRALSLIKSIDQEIKTYFDQERILISALIGNKERIATKMIKDKEELTSRIQSDYDTLNNLMNKRRAIKNAIVLSNATSTVNINDQEITVAEAIELKNHLPVREHVLKAYRNQYSATQKFLDKNASEVENRINELIKIQVNEDTKPEDKLKIMDIIRENENNTSLATLFDPINLIDKIKKTETEINNIKSELDYVLSEHNAVTTITVSY